MRRIAFDITDYQSEKIEEFRKTNKGTITVAEFFRNMLNQYIEALLLEGDS